MHVNIDADAGLLIAHRHDQVRRLSPDSGQGDQLVDRIRHGPPVHIQEPPTDRVDRFGLGAIEPDGIDGLFDLFER